MDHQDPILEAGSKKEKKAGMLLQAVEKKPAKPGEGPARVASAMMDSSHYIVPLITIAVGCFWWNCAWLVYHASDWVKQRQILMDILGPGSKLDIIFAILHFANASSDLVLLVAILRDEYTHSNNQNSTIALKLFIAWNTLGAFLTWFFFCIHVIIFNQFETKKHLSGTDSQSLNTTSNESSVTRQGGSTGLRLFGHTLAAAFKALMLSKVFYAYYNRIKDDDVRLGLSHPFFAMSPHLSQSQEDVRSGSMISWIPHRFRSLASKLSPTVKSVDRSGRTPKGCDNPKIQNDAKACSDVLEDSDVYERKNYPLEQWFDAENMMNSYPSVHQSGAFPLLVVPNEQVSKKYIP